MLRNPTITAALAAAAFVLGLAAPALADVPPRRERTTRTVEPHRAPPMTPPLEQAPPPETNPPPEQAPEPAVQPTPEAAPPPAQPKAAQPKAAQPEAKAEEDKSGSCSIGGGSDSAIASLAALIMLIGGAGLLRRR